MSIISSTTLTDPTQLKFGFGLVLVYNYLATPVHYNKPDGYWKIWVHRPLFYLLGLALSLLIDGLYNVVRSVLQQ